MVYDGYGNIVSKNGIAYTYGDPAWKDLLTAYNGQPITYDKQGNPTTYLGHTLAWEKGRQLKSFDGNTYTYCFVRCGIQKHTGHPMRFISKLGVFVFHILPRNVV